MTDEGSGEAVLCRRLGELLSVSEHVACPYCFGRSAEVESQEHGRFCDYDAARDPIVFGFPDSFGRMSRG